MIKAVFILPFCAIALASCVSSGGTFCTVAKPIRPANVDALSDSDVAAILAHNEKGAALCGWRK